MDAQVLNAGARLLGFDADEDEQDEVSLHTAGEEGSIDRYQHPMQITRLS